MQRQREEAKKKLVEDARARRRGGRLKPVG
jgi:hypothetical protein